MYQNRPRRFRRHSNGRKHQLHDNGGTQARLRSNSFSNSQTRNHFRTPQSAEKLFEKYNNLAKEAMTSGDRTLSENYLQHADHFTRIIEDKNKNLEKNIKIETSNKPKQDNNNTSENIETNLRNIEKKE